ncbi:hypothetical protein REPUB_Repub03eG0113900 [Reevesia pubescens]
MDLFRVFPRNGGFPVLLLLFGLYALEEEQLFPDSLWWIDPVTCIPAALHSSVKTFVSWLWGVLRDSNCNIMAIFTGPLGILDSNVAKLMAIRHALLVFKNSRKLTGNGLIIESDSRNAVVWCTDESSRPWKLSSIFADIDSDVQSIGNVCFVNIFREANGFADALAKAGVHRPTFFSAWW